MKILITAVALTFAVPAFAQTAPAPAATQTPGHEGHAGHAQTGAPAGHAGHHGAQHQDGQHHGDGHQGGHMAMDCCADRDGNGRMDCCDAMAARHGTQPTAPSATPQPQSQPNR